MGDLNFSNYLNSDNYVLIFMPTSILAGFFPKDNNPPTAILCTSSTIYKLIYMVGIFLVYNCGSHEITLICNIYLCAWLF